MSTLVAGVLLYRHLPPASEPGVTARALADELDLTPRTVQRHLVEFERAGLARCNPALWPHPWWRR